MKRRRFLQQASAAVIPALFMDFKTIEKELTHHATEKMPVLFVGHGSPMNAIEDNAYSRAWKNTGMQIGKPAAILCISAHWLTNGTYVHVGEHPKTIHDFGGFPDKLFQQQYPAPGAPDMAKNTINAVKQTQILPDNEWGLDHGAWSVLMHLYPGADVPVYQMSLDYSKPLSYHYNLAAELAALRKKGVLIVCSGNVVHNLMRLNFSHNATPFDWALEFDQLVATTVEKNADSTLVNMALDNPLMRMAHPTHDHFLPLIYALGARDKKDDYRFFNDSIDMASVSMRSVIWQ